MFTIGMFYTRRQIYAILGGSMQSYLPMVAGQVIAACLKLNMNPQAPYVIVCGNEPAVAAAGEALANQQGNLPVFIKRGVNQWEYQGEFSVVNNHVHGPRFDELVNNAGRNPPTVSRVIELVNA